MYPPTPHPLKTAKTRHFSDVLLLILDSLLFYLARAYSTTVAKTSRVPAISTSGPNPKPNNKPDMMLAARRLRKTPPFSPLFPNPFPLPLLLLPFSVVGVLSAVFRVPRRMFPAPRSTPNQLRS